MLTDQDAKQMGFVFGIGARVVRAIEAAVLSKLTAGYVVPEPVHHIMSDGVSIGYYSLDQLQAYAAGRAAGLSAEPVGYTYTIRDVAHGAIDDQTLKAGTPLYTKEEL